MAVTSALSAGRLSTPRKTPGTHFCYRLSRPQDHSAAGRIRSTGKSNDVGNQTPLHPPACNTVPQPAMLPRAPRRLQIINIFLFSHVRGNLPPHIDDKVREPCFQNEFLHWPLAEVVAYSVPGKPALLHRLLQCWHMDIIRDVENTVINWTFCVNSL
jgi:hypothetical protein